MHAQVPLPPVFVMAAGEGELKIVEQLLKAGEKVNQTDSVRFRIFLSLLIFLTRILVQGRQSQLI